MSARKLAYQGLVFGPAVLLGYLGLGARAYEDTFEPIQFGTAEQALVEAYVEPMRLVLQMPQNFHTPAQRSTAREIARTWAKLGAAGVLKPIPEADPEAPERCTVKDQIAVARARIVGCLAACGQVEFGAGNYVRASQDLMLSYRVAQFGKDSDLLSIAQAARHQWFALDRLVAMAPHLDVGQRRVIAQSLEDVAKRDGRAAKYLAVIGHRFPPSIAQRASQPGPAIVLVGGTQDDTDSPNLTATERRPFLLATVCYRDQQVALKHALAVLRGQETFGAKPVRSATDLFDEPGKRHGPYPTAREHASRIESSWLAMDAVSGTNLTGSR